MASGFKHEKVLGDFTGKGIVRRFSMIIDLCKKFK